MYRLVREARDIAWLEIAGMSNYRNYDYKEARADFLASFPSIVGTMAAPKSGTNDLQQPMLQRAVIEVWQKKAQKQKSLI